MSYNSASWGDMRTSKWMCVKNLLLKTLKCDRNTEISSECIDNARHTANPNENSQWPQLLLV